MDTRNGLSLRLLGALAMRPAGPGLILVAGVLALAVSGEPLTTAPWFWPATTTIVVLMVVMNTAWQDIRRRVHARRHQRRMYTANTLLNDRPSLLDSEIEITGSIRELGWLVEGFGHKLDDLLTEVHDEKSAADQRSHRS
jgi:hypothetical protein